MKLRTFLAKDMREALAHVRSEMGPEAVIVASERAKGGGIVVRAALDEPETSIEDTEAAHASTNEETSAAGFEASYRDGLIRRLRAPARAAQHTTRNFDRAELLSILRGHRAPDGLAHELAQAAEKCALSDMTLALASALDKRMRSAPLELGSCSALLLCGAPGAGKTATAAKIAAHAMLSGRAVRLIAADAAGAGAVARLETFAKHLGAELVVAGSAAELERLVGTAQGALAIVDTAGFDPRLAKARTAFSALGRIEKLETIAVLSAGADAEEAAELASAFAALGATRMIVTCLDLARRAGALLAAAVQGTPLAYVTRSPYVAGGLETLTPLSLSRLLIEAGRADQGSAQ